ncbi:FAD2 [Auxenochlorella protothecoides x Auxenochlorella symbiontica]
MAAVKRQSVAKPPFTIGTLRKAIPAHCFERSALHSAAYLMVDVALVAALYVASTYIDPAPLPTWFKYTFLWPTYWFFQGAVGTGIWVIAHECGHQAFSTSQTINDGVGLVFHSLLLVPYYSWKHSHRRHHSNTGCVDKDEVFVPAQREEPHEGFEWEQTAPARLAHIAVALLLGWPLYLAFNASSRPYPRFANHFDPWSPIFSKRERAEVALSDAALVAVVSGLGLLARSFGTAWLVKTYVVPYFVVNAWLVTITLLQHTHPALPHYYEKDWDWLRGAMATVDRSMGPPFLDVFFHHISDTHVCHHLFSQIPHYHAQEATAAIKPILKEYYQKDDRWVGRAVWEDYSACRYVAPDTKEDDSALWFRK